MLGRELVDAVLRDIDSAPISLHLRLTLQFLRKLTLTPQDVSATDVRVLFEAGVGGEAVEHAIQVCAIFNIVDRLADSFAFKVHDQPYFDRGGEMLLKYGYR